MSGRVVAKLERWWTVDLPKRALDVVGSAGALAVLAIPMAVIWAAVRATMGAPAVFRQRRPGRAAVPFTLYKFRTM
ncbi:sugar transferase, partial [Salmonella sp. SAL4457]|uniref:sugar transferase n=1 Tax=Salmonella sp. SAL4457 TaxID=3159912 RepID=UPI00397B01B3